MIVGVRFCLHATPHALKIMMIMLGYHAVAWGVCAVTHPLPRPSLSPHTWLFCHALNVEYHLPLLWLPSSYWQGRRSTGRVQLPACVGG